jgi:hypothetical protein
MSTVGNHFYAPLYPVEFYLIDDNNGLEGIVMQSSAFG